MKYLLLTKTYKRVGYITEEVVCDTICISLEDATYRMGLLRKEGHTFHSLYEITGRSFEIDDTVLWKNKNG